MRAKMLVSDTCTLGVPRAPKSRAKNDAGALTGEKQHISLEAAVPVDAEAQALRGVVVAADEAHLVERALPEAHHLVRRVVPVALVGEAVRPVEVDLRRQRLPRRVRPVRVVRELRREIA